MADGIVGSLNGCVGPLAADYLELVRRSAYAQACIAEAMGFLEDNWRLDARYWAIKALVRANDMLREGK